MPMVFSVIYYSTLTISTLIILFSEMFLKNCENIFWTTEFGKKNIKYLKYSE
jgi:hypothetical protein